MPWVTNEDGSIVMGDDGNPMYRYADGNEIAFNADDQVKKIRELTTKASKRKETIESLNKTMGVLGDNGIDTSSGDGIKEFITTAKKNAETVANLEAGDIVKSDDVQKIKDGVAESFKTQMAQQEKNFLKKMQVKDEEIAKKDKAIRKSLIRGAFMSNEFIRKKTSYPTPESAYNDLKGKFTVEEVNGESKAFGLDSEGNKLYSRKSPTEHAGIHEAIEIIITSHPQKDSLLLVEGGGSGGDNQNKHKQTVANTKFVDKGDRLAIGKNAADIASGKMKVKME